MAGILALIGIMNFFNTSMTSILSRKRELALLEIVGMTKKQIRQMLMMEGCIYICGAFFIALLIILTSTKRILESTIGIAWYFQLRITIIPCLYILPVLLFISCIIPIYNYRIMSRESVMERVCLEHE